jgi:hypothetical protein
MPKIPTNKSTYFTIHDELFPLELVFNNGINIIIPIPPKKLAKKVNKATKYSFPPVYLL